MGSTHLSQTHKPSPIFSSSQFIEIPPNSCGYRPGHGAYTSYQHKITQQQVDKYQLTFNSKKQQQLYYQCFLQRYRQQYIVNTIQYMDLTGREFCSSLYRADVYIQHIPVRLGDITDLPFLDSLYILKNSLLGFGLLFSMIGYFYVQQDHICVNNYGELKVWLNSDLSKNYPQDSEQKYLTKSQRDMVSRILYLIQNNTMLQHCPIEFSQYLKKRYKTYPNFSQASKLLQQYASEYQIVLPKYCESIMKIFLEEEDPEGQFGIEISGNNNLNDETGREKDMQRYPEEGSNDFRNFGVQDYVIEETQNNRNSDNIQRRNNNLDELEVNNVIIPKLQFRQPSFNRREVKTMRSTFKFQQNNSFKQENPQKTRKLQQNTDRVYYGASPNYYIKNSPTRPPIILSVPMTHSQQITINPEGKPIIHTTINAPNLFNHNPKLNLRPAINFCYRSPYLGVYPCYQPIQLIPRIGLAVHQSMTHAPVKAKNIPITNPHQNNLDQLQSNFKFGNNYHSKQKNIYQSQSIPTDKARPIFSDKNANNFKQQKELSNKKQLKSKDNPILDHKNSKFYKKQQVNISIDKKTLNQKSKNKSQGQALNSSINKNTSKQKSPVKIITKNKNPDTSVATNNTSQNINKNKSLEFSSSLSKTKKGINTIFGQQKHKTLYYETGTGSEQIDPQIAADLLQYL